jgi:hypothetical protein
MGRDVRTRWCRIGALHVDRLDKFVEKSAHQVKPSSKVSWWGHWWVRVPEFSRLLSSNLLCSLHTCQKARNMPITRAKAQPAALASAEKDICFDLEIYSGQVRIRMLSYPREG